MNNKTLTKLKNGVMGIIIALAVSGVNAQEAPVNWRITGSPADVEAIQQIVNTFDQTWGNDAVTYAAQYGSVAEWVGPDGTILTDPAEITALYTFFFTIFAGTTRTSEIRNITFISGTAAVLDVDARVAGVGQAREKNVLIKRAGEWRIVLHQQTFF